MRTKYRGFELKVEQQKWGRETILKYSVVRKNDNFTIYSGTSYENDSIYKFTKFLKGVVDDFLSDPAPYYTETASDDGSEAIEDWELEEEPEESEEESL